LSDACPAGRAAVGPPTEGVLPLVFIGASPPSAKNACYFFNRMEKDGVRFVSYHFADRAELTERFAEASAAIRSLAQTSSAAGT
jgi:hypothetical protein